jgi:hypothetical protein
MPAIEGLVLACVAVGRAQSRGPVQRRLAELSPVVRAALSRALRSARRGASGTGLVGLPALLRRFPRTAAPLVDCALSPARKCRSGRAAGTVTLPGTASAGCEGMPVPRLWSTGTSGGFGEVGAPNRASRRVPLSLRWTRNTTTVLSLQGFWTAPRNTIRHSSRNESGGATAHTQRKKEQRRGGDVGAALHTGLSRRSEEPSRT